MDGKYRSISGRVGLWDGADPKGKLRFQIYGDDRKILWESRFVNKAGQAIPYRVNITDVDELSVVAECHGSSQDGHIVWLEPKLTPK